MKGERILYLILIFAAIVVGIYGYTSGLLTPHHYHLVKKLPNSGFDNKDIFCEDATRVFYINNRENYLTDSEVLENFGIDLIYLRSNDRLGDSYGGRFKEITYNAKIWDTSSFKTWGEFYEDILNNWERSRPEYIKHDMLSNTFSFNRYPDNYDESKMEKYITCKLTKQFLQRN